jgi:hypothetical protein
MTLAGMMLRDWGITNDKKMNRRVEEEEETEARATDEGKGCLMHLARGEKGMEKWTEAVRSSQKVCLPCLLWLTSE